MILVATSGVSLSIYILLDNGLFSGQRFFFGLFRPSDGLDALQVISRVGGALSILLILFGGWTLILPVLPLRKYRSQWRRLSRQPGISACLAVATGMVVWAGVACVTLWLRAQFEGQPGLPPGLLGSVSGLRWPDRLRGHLGGRRLGGPDRHGAMAPERQRVRPARPMPGRPLVRGRGDVRRAFAAELIARCRGGDPASMPCSLRDRVSAWSVRLPRSPGATARPGV